MSGKAIDYTGQVFGFLTAIRFSRHIGPKRAWVFKCQCGNECEKTIAWVVRDLKRGRTPSCGCLTSQGKAEGGRQSAKVRRSPLATAAVANEHVLYCTWTSMKTRCYNHHRRSWSCYGGRGITVCDRWKEDFWAFVADMYPTWKPGLTLDRIDNDSGYCPENCRWATVKEQSLNRRNNVVVDGETLSQIAERTGISYSTIVDRYKHGKRGDALTCPPNSIRK